MECIKMLNSINETDNEVGDLQDVYIYLKTIKEL